MEDDKPLTRSEYYKQKKKKQHYVVDKREEDNIVGKSRNGKNKLENVLKTWETGTFNSIKEKKCNNIVIELHTVWKLLTE
jgi:hypothetical protein